MRIERKSDSIEGFCNPWSDSHREISVIKFIKNNNKWTVASSMCMPSDIKAAIVIQECVDMAFYELGVL